MESRELSSLQTLLLKYIFPPLWIGGFGIGTVAMWHGALEHGRSNDPPAVLFLAAWIFGTSMILWSCGRLKRVRLEQDKLYVSNYFREIAVPLSEIDDVTEFRWINIHPVTIHLRHATPFGERIVFMPKARFFFSPWSSHPVVEELKQEARRCRSAALVAETALQRTVRK